MKIQLIGTTNKFFLIFVFIQIVEEHIIGNLCKSMFLKCDRKIF